MTVEKPLMKPAGVASQAPAAMKPAVTKRTCFDTGFFRCRGVTKKLVATVSDLAWPGTCVGCGEWSDTTWCNVCRADCDPRELHRVLRPSGLEVYAAMSYDGPMKQAITAYKDQGRHDAVSELSNLLRYACAAAIRAAPSNIKTWFITPVPSSRGARQARGFSPVDELITAALRGQPRWGPRLVVHKKVADQSHLGRVARQQNVTGAFALTHSVTLPPTSGLVLIDDVVTSGATLQAAFEALNDTQPVHTVAATIASAELKVGRKEQRKIIV